MCHNPLVIMDALSSPLREFPYQFLSINSPLSIPLFIKRQTPISKYYALMNNCRTLISKRGKQEKMQKQVAPKLSWIFFIYSKKRLVPSCFLLSISNLFVLYRSTPLSTFAFKEVLEYIPLSKVLLPQVFLLSHETAETSMNCLFPKLNHIISCIQQFQLDRDSFDFTIKSTISHMLRQHVILQSLQESFQMTIDEFSFIESWNEMLDTKIQAMRESLSTLDEEGLDYSLRSRVEKWIKMCKSGQTKYSRN